jgi:hypothetical protein
VTQDGTSNPVVEVAGADTESGEAQVLVIVGHVIVREASWLSQSDQC